ncbi:MAG: hypothetical protein RLZZ127_2407 [Planctomycetota bacterium]|jgi:hypothetical protein
MLVELHYVEIPDKTTRRLTVPEYDLPIIKLLWKLPPDKRITSTPSGLVVPRNFVDELKRMRNEHAAVPDGRDKQAWRVVYPTDDDLLEAYQKAVRKGLEIHERAQLAQAQAAARLRKEEEAGRLEADQALARQIREEVQKGIAEATDPAFEERMRAEIAAQVEAELREKIEAEVRAELEAKAKKGK